MSYFGDVLDDAHDRMKVEMDEPGKVEDPKTMAFKVKSSAGDASLAQGMDMVPKGDGWQFKSKTEVKNKFNKEHSVKFTTKNKDHELEWGFKPADLNKDGKEVDLEVKATCNPKGNSGADVDIKGKLQLGGFGSDTVKSWTELEAVTDTKSLTTAEFSQNVAVQNDGKTIHAGVKAVWDNKSKKAEEIYGQFAVHGFEWGSTWARYARLQNSGQWATFGFDANKTAGLPHDQSFEASWDLTNKFQGFYGKPLLLNYAHHLKLNNKSNVNFSFCFGKEWIAASKYQWTAGPWKLTYSDKGDLKKFVTKPKEFWYKCGLAVELKL